jgi:hypothetical protein
VIESVNDGELIPLTCDTEAVGPCDECEDDESEYWCLDGRLRCVWCGRSIQRCPACNEGPILSRLADLEGD